ncbi:hypothetical protein [Mailhella sp.]|uniref:hypothetical protein n=1 Tax=Mailhella sp. TaxID=1981029 RepID=UPI003AB68EEE
MATAMNELEKIALHLENGADLTFYGRLFSEAVWYDEDSGVLTHQKLYVTDQNEQVYVIQKGSGAKNFCRAYRVSVHGERCVIYNGRYSMEIPLDLLLLAVRSLCGMEDGAALEQAEEILRAANC